MSTKKLIILGSVAVVLFIVGIGGFIYLRMQPRRLIWDFRSSRDPSVIGWTPKGSSDISYDLNGDFDFTLILVDGSTFHQRCWAVGCETNKGKICQIYAHFGHNIKVTDAVVIAHQALLDWYGGVDKTWVGGDVPVDEWLKHVADGTDRHMWYTMHAGGVNISINMIGGSYDQGLNRTCNLTLEVGVAKP